MEVKQANNIRLQVLRESEDDFKHTLNLSGNSSFEDFFEYKTVGTFCRTKVKRSPMMTKNKLDSPNTQVQKFIEKVQRNVKSTNDVDNNTAILSFKQEVCDSAKEILQRSTSSSCSDVGESASKRQKISEKMIDNCDRNFLVVTPNNESEVQRRNNRERKDTNESDYYDAVEDIENEPAISQRFSINLSEIAGRRSIPILRRSISETNRESWDPERSSWVFVPECTVKILVEVSDERFVLNAQNLIEVLIEKELQMKKKLFTYNY